MHSLITGGTRAHRLTEAARRQEVARAASVITVPAAAMPFRLLQPAELPVARPRVIRIDDAEEGFPNRQEMGTRLILTQSTYTLQKWLDLVGSVDSLILTADRESLARVAPEAFQRRGPWRHFDIVDLGHIVDMRPEERGSDPAANGLSPIEEQLVRAYGSESTEERLRLCREALKEAPKSPAAALALASACREAQDLQGARQALDLAHKLAPKWEAVYYEDGKFWLGYDDMDRAHEGFQRAKDLMPSFSAACSNLGATLGELGEPEAALAAFKQALRYDADSFTILNNIGVVTRELGRLDESEDALLSVIELAPHFIFGYYNLGHTRFLRGDYAGALQAYEEGQRRDPHKNRRQACRLALVRFANQDVEGAERDLWRYADQAPADEREDLLLEAFEVGQALLVQQPGLEAHRAFLARIAAELTK